jgi:ABC-2 type transport system ATP-binding protein
MTLRFDGLSRRYGEVVALDRLTFEVPAGRVVGFLGPNGAGKTTTMRAVFGLVALDAGSVTWDGKAIGQAERRRFGYMPEERGLYPGMVVGQQVEYLARLHGFSAADAETATARWLERVGIAERAGSKLEALSLGNQQRVQLAAARVHGPELLVLDEPFSGLDPAGVDAMSQVLAERAAAGVTMLFSSHQLDLVEHLCESVAIIHRGRLVAEGTVKDLGQAGQLRITVRVAGDDADRWAQDLGGAASVENNTGGTVLLSLRDRADAQAVLDRARAAGPVEHFTFERRTLSEVFRDAVGSGADAGTGADPGAGAGTGGGRT